MESNSLSHQLSMAMDNIKRSQKHMFKVFHTDEQPIFILMHFEEASQGGSVPISALKEAMGVTAAAATQFIKRLEDFEYVQREVDSVDRRVVKVSLTEKGKTAVTQAKACFAMALDGLVENLGKEDAENLIRLLNKTSIYMEKEFLK